MLLLKQQLRHLHISLAEAASATGVSKPAIVDLINHGRWPRRNPEQLRKRITELLSSHNVDTTHSFDEVGLQATAVAQVPQTTEEDSMLLKKQSLSQNAKRAFKLKANPFDDLSVQCADDVFTTPDIIYVREAMYQTATHGGMLAIWGESGSGKSTLRCDLIDRLLRERRKIVVIEPYVLAMEDNDRTGKTLKSVSIAEAILREVAPGERPKLSAEARFSQVHKALIASATGEEDNSHVLIIEEAHALPTPTLKHLKRFLELKMGHKQLMGIILIGQQELCSKLSERQASVREVVQRCELIQLKPLTNDLEAFLTFKLARVDKKPGDIFDASTIPAIMEKMTARNHKGEITHNALYPLAIGNLMTAAINAAAGLGVPVVNAEIIKSL
ncbi:TPA: AAA family ATPase [Salmonella enterica]|uniref:AAA family ATPase n=1 Tax=Salmonella enterica TaxID=28901 RepID=A0A743SP58_SALER|nr:AAA family ATPase [Salmonella enterica]